MQIVNDKGYTKHYFEEGKRICSKIGSGELQNVNQKVDHMEMDYEAQRSRQFDGITNTYEGCMEITPYINNGNLYDNIIKKYEYQVNSGEPIFYYHSDHLGSASFLTDSSGAETQQLVYLPFGEDWVDKKYNNPQFQTPYKFNGKEKDQETGYNNYGVRYYNDKLSIWLSVDPMSDKYPHQTNYIYCSNNPVMVIDPDGRDEWDVCVQTGKMDWKKKSDKDVIFLTYNGKRTGEHSKEFDKGSFTRVESPEKDDKGIPEYTDVKFANKEVGQEVFNFLADKTEVEWSKLLSENKTTGIQSIDVYTSHDKSSEARGPFMTRLKDFSDNNKLVELEHSHPYNKFKSNVCPQCSSEADRNHRDDMKKIHPNAKFYIRHSGGNRREYTKDTKNNYGK